jgi:hydrogenase maturation factor
MAPTKNVGRETPELADFKFAREPRSALGLDDSVQYEATTVPSIPISEEAKGACEILGLDPLYVANEGKLLAIVANEDVDATLSALRSLSLGENAAIIGEVVDEHPGFVMMKTRVGGTRVVDMLSGEQLPRIC